jgi:hypothetical protein
MLNERKTDRLTPGSLQMQSAPNAIKTLFTFPDNSRQSWNLILFSSALQEWRTRTVKRDGHWLLY